MEAQVKRRAPKRGRGDAAEETARLGVATENVQRKFGESSENVRRMFRRKDVHKKEVKWVQTLGSVALGAWAVALFRLELGRWPSWAVALFHIRSRPRPHVPSRSQSRTPKEA